MIFSSLTFMLGFLPIVLFVYYCILAKASINIKNIFLFIASILFYAWGEPKFVLALLASILINWFFGIMVDKYRDNKVISRLSITIMLILNIGLLFVYKYLMFTVTNVNILFYMSYTVPKILLPVGISFFTFQAISYVIDVYRRTAAIQKNPLDVGLYIAFFPQLVAGPIVRYNTIAEQIRERHTTIDDFTKGFCRFVIGLVKKILIADNISIIADKAFNMDVSILPVSLAILGAIAFMLQIYFDFSSYSDMAIGLGRMFGFRFMENFNYPYIASSITDFWRRWHISLSSWLRDYIYIPLGGNRVKTKTRWIFNLFMVWLVTGVWHGANWTFIVWGLMYFVLIAFEKLTKIDKMKPNIVGYILTPIITLFGWIIFRSANLSAAIDYIQVMLGFAGHQWINDTALFYITENWVFLVIAVIASLPILPWTKKYIQNNPILSILAVVFLVILFIICVGSIIKVSYNPFIYFNF